jgi:hypothetical protein
MISRKCDGEGNRTDFKLSQPEDYISSEEYHNVVLIGRLKKRVTSVDNDEIYELTSLTSKL